MAKHNSNVERRETGTKPDRTVGFYVRLREQTADLVEKDARNGRRSRTAQISYIVEQFFRSSGEIR